MLLPESLGVSTARTPAGGDTAQAVPVMRNDASRIKELFPIFVVTWCGAPPPSARPRAGSDATDNRATVPSPRRLCIAVCAPVSVPGLDGALRERGGSARAFSTERWPGISLGTREGEQERAGQSALCVRR